MAGVATGDVLHDPPAGEDLNLIGVATFRHAARAFQPHCLEWEVAPKPRQQHGLIERHMPSAAMPPAANGIEIGDPPGVYVLLDVGQCDALRAVRGLLHR